MQRPFFIHCLSPLHAGTGQAVDLIDLPIARYAATKIPYLPGSSIKGVVRDARRPRVPLPGNRADVDQGQWGPYLAAFGPDVDSDASEHAGAVSFSDARLLVLPVRSLRGTFAYATSPLLLRFAAQDLRDAKVSLPDIPNVPTAGSTPCALVPQTPTSVLVHGAGKDGRLFLEELDFIVTSDERTSAWAEWLGARLLGPRAKDFAQRFTVIDDEAMGFLWETATQVDAHNRINDRGTVAKGQLWYEENLPPETVLMGLATASNSLRGVGGDANAMLTVALPAAGDVLQFGGKATVGKGRAQFIPVQ